MDILSQINDLFDEIPESPKDEKVEVKESIDVKKADMGEVIKDFRKSDAPQFKGKSKKKKQEMAVAAKLQAEEPKKVKEQYSSYEERLMGTVVHQISKNAKNENLQLKEVPQTLDEERFRQLETQLLQVKQLFHEATMVSGIGQGGDGQTPGSGEVRILRMDDVHAPNGISKGQGVVWDALIGKFVPGAADNDGGGGVIFAVDQLVAGPGVDLNPPGGVGTVTVSVDLALEELRNVSGTPVDGDLLIYNGLDWSTGTLTDTEIRISTPDANNGNALTQEEANEYFGATLDNHDGRIDALENATTPGTFLGAVDVTDPNNEPDTATLNNGDYFIHEGAAGPVWGVGDNVDDGNQVIWDGTVWKIVSTVSTLQQLGDTDVDSAITGDFLVYNDGNGKWENQTVDIPKVTIGSVEPNTGEEAQGDFWFDNVNEVLYIYDTVWKVAGGSGGAAVTISATPPTDPVPELGDLWVSDDNWAMYTFDGFNWVALTNNGLVGGDSGTGFVTGAELDAVTDTLNFNTTEVQNNLNVAVLALDQTHLRITPQAQLLGPLLLSDDNITAVKQATTKEYVDTLVSTTAADYLLKAGGQLTGTLTFMRGNKTTPQFKISPNSSETDFATNIYSLNNGQMRLRTSHTNDEGDHDGSHIVMDPNNGTPQTKIYHVVTPTSGEMAASKEYVDGQIAALPTPAGVPVGCIMIWMSSSPPAGWFKLQGGTFDINTYPQLHAYLQSTGAYTTGTLPNWSGHYPGEYGDHLTSSLGTKQNQKTAAPNAGFPRSSSSIPNGNKRTFNGTGGTNAYSDGVSKVTINENWDSVTRPPTVVVHYIIKHD